MVPRRKENIRIIVADDHPFYLQGMKMVLRKLPYVAEVKGAENGIEVLNLLKENNGDCDIIFMDISMPKMNGIEATHKIRTLYPKVLVLAITMNEDYKSATNILDAGAIGYLSKNINKKELEIAIANVLDGKMYFSNEISEVLLQHITRHRQSPLDPNDPNNITERELEVLLLICDGLQAEEIAAKLFLSIHTVNTHRMRLLEKTNTNSILSLVKYAIAKGIYKMPY